MDIGVCSINFQSNIMKYLLIIIIFYKLTSIIIIYIHIIYYDVLHAGHFKRRRLVGSFLYIIRYNNNMMYVYNIYILYTHYINVYV